MKSSSLILGTLLVLIFNLNLQAQAGRQEQALVDPVIVKKIFSHRCDECHGAELEVKADGWGPSTDLEMMIKGKYVVPKNVRWSTILETINPVSGHMPPQGAKNGSLTQKEFDLIKLWIQQGALLSIPESAKPDPISSVESDPIPNNTTTENTTPDQPEPDSNEGSTSSEVTVISTDPAETITTTTAPAVMSADDFVLEDTTKELTGTDRLFNLIGKMHPAATHFPVALLLLAFVAELLFLFTRHPRYRSIVTFLLIFGTIGVVIAMITGWKREDFGGYAGSEIVEYHQWGAYTTFMLALIALGLDHWRRKAFQAYEALEDQDGVSVNPAAVWSVRICLLLIAIAVGMTGFLGGAVTRGFDYYQL